jgi:DNA repair protein RecO (recombination protein O)
VRTLAKAEWLGGMPLLSGRCLMLGYYLNELLVKLLPREDAHVALFDTYFAALSALAQGGADAPELRRFEISLLRELGYGLTLDVDADSGEPVQTSADYAFVLERGPVQKVGAGDTALEQGLRGKTLIDMAADDYSDPRTRLESKILMRRLLAHHLGGQPLQARRVFMELQEL